MFSFEKTSEEDGCGARRTDTITIGHARYKRVTRRLATLTSCLQACLARLKKSSRIETSRGPGTSSKLSPALKLPGSRTAR